MRNQLMQRSDESQKWMLKVTDLTAFQQFLKENNLENAAYRAYPEANIIFINASFSVIYEKLLHSHLVVFIDRADRQPQVESAVSFFDISANKVNLVHSVYPNLNGKGQTVSVKEEDFDLEDIDFAGRILLSDGASGKLSTHATIMSSIIGGGGNTFYSGKGVAWGAHLTSADFEF
ncbi:MAG: hypothetical protein IPJ74_01210 [Saprospiraceae bacterium]|nr:hypothetical protein [Saprospiraceae bacterium]